MRIRTKKKGNKKGGYRGNDILLWLSIVEGKYESNKQIGSLGRSFFEECSRKNVLNNVLRNVSRTFSGTSTMNII